MIMTPSRLQISNPNRICDTTSKSPITPDSPPILNNNESTQTHNNNGTSTSSEYDSKEVPAMLNLTDCHHMHLSYQFSTSSNQSPHNYNPLICPETKLETPDIFTICNQKGYQIIRKMRDTLQGQMFQAIRTSDNMSIAIKQTSKHLHNSKISEQDGMNIIVNENIILESIILHHLTVANRPIGDYIVQFIEFFESETDYYLCMEYIEQYLTLRQFTNKCHAYINAHKLSLSHYKHLIKYILWQVTATIHWMHHDMNCCHLDLNIDNIMITNATFVEHSDGSVSINNCIKVKLIDFGLAEMWNDNSTFDCLKSGMTANQCYVAPKVFNDDMYDARASDIWSLGIILYYAAIGTMPYTKPLSTDNGYFAIECGQLSAWFRRINKVRYVNNGLSTLIVGLLSVEEKCRLNIKQVMQSNFLRSYYHKYGNRIMEKSAIQRKHSCDRMQRKRMIGFPFYSLNC